jgi:outer membrane lipoprotein-sorting protein
MKILMILLVLCIAVPARAADIGPPGVMTLMARAPASTAAFTETHVLSMLDQPVVSRGTLAWKPPAHVEKITTSPAPESLVADGDAVTLTQGGKTRALSLSSTPVLGALVAAVTGTLGGDLNLLSRYYNLTSTGDAKHWVLFLLPKQDDVQKLIQYVRIIGADAQLERVEILETDGDRSDMVITPR